MKIYNETLHNEQGIYQRTDVSDGDTITHIYEDPRYGLVVEVDANPDASDTKVYVNDRKVFGP